MGHSLSRAALSVFVATLAVANAACGEAAPTEAQRASTSKQEILIPRFPSVGRLPPSGFGENGDQKIPLPGSTIPEGAPDPCDVGRGQMRGAGCSGNPGDTYVPAQACQDGSPGCVDGVRPSGFINETTDPAPIPPQVASADDGSTPQASGGDDDDGSGGGDTFAWRRLHAHR